MSTPEPRIGFVSLGCPKALVDSEQILSRLRAEGYGIAPDYAGADLVVVNTCGFIDSAVAESLDAIGEAMSENGRVVVTGCLGKDAARIQAAHPGVLAVTGPQAFEEVMAAVHQQVPPPHDPFASLLPPQGIKLTPRHYAYLKISEGCNHRCSFCIIPSLRGDLVSRPIGEILGEAERLAAAGVRELLVISQDTSAYGVDVRYRTGFFGGRPLKSDIEHLATALGDLGIWVRLHYVYPYPHVDRLIPLMAQGRLLPYLDMPLQHGHPRVLKAMRRPAAAERVLERIRRWREQVPELTLRSTFIVGFPGETEREFEALLQFLEEAQLDRVGAFAYSPVEGAAANALTDPVPEAEKQARLEAFMEGKGVLFKRFANIDVYDIEVDSAQPEDFINTVSRIAGGFGGINLEDIAAPHCFEIEKRLSERLDIPVFHDDQHGTAIITAAGLLNALEIQGKKLQESRIVCVGAGAAGIASMRLLQRLGALRKNIFMVDRKGVIHDQRTDLNEFKQIFAQDTEARTLADACMGADVFIGLSGPDLLTPEMLLSMAPRPVIFALSNPDPEITPELALQTRDDLIMATGRSDYPNQVNNVLGFPFIFRGALDVRARHITDEMHVAAVHALANLAREPVPQSVLDAYGKEKLEFGPEYILPTPFDPRLIDTIPAAVAQAARDSGVARI